MAKNTNTNKTSAHLAGVAGNRREAHFANGGTLAEWRGGLSTRIPSGKTYKRRSKHRGED